MTELCRKYDVKIISDEIWSDIILAGHQHIPTQSVSEDAKGRTVALYAPSKTFNLAGLIGSYHIIYDPDIRKKVRKQSSLSHYNDMNVLSMYALIGAYSDNGMVWVDELRQVIGKNVDFACDFIDQNFEGVSVTKPDGTYMLWVDCGQWCREHGRDLQAVEEACWKVGAAVQDGRMFHGHSHLRMNLALPYSRVTEAFERMQKYVF
jgi:cystathionine beta-lyase